MKKGLIYICCICILIVVSAFQKDHAEKDSIKLDTMEQAPVPIPALVQIKLKEKIDAYKHDFMNQCRESILSEAEIYVDSIISVQLNPPSIDSTQAPPKPERPSRPYDSLILDSFSIDPLINDSIIMDSIR